MRYIKLTLYQVHTKKDYPSLSSNNAKVSFDIPELLWTRGLFAKCVNEHELLGKIVLHKSQSAQRVHERDSKYKLVSLSNSNMLSSMNQS